MKHNLDLAKERMANQGPTIYDNCEVNYLYGLDDLCKQFIQPTYDMLELGVNDGVSTELFSYYAQSITAIDRKSSSALKRVLSQRKNIQFLKMNFDNFWKTNAKKFDLIYIDGCHDFNSVSVDIKNSLQHVKENGIICGHDMTSLTPGVKKAVNRIFPTKHIHQFCDGSWLIRLP